MDFYTSGKDNLEPHTFHTGLGVLVVHNNRILEQASANHLLLQSRLEINDIGAANTKRLRSGKGLGTIYLLIVYIKLMSEYTVLKRGEKRDSI
jgi:hypothetical protein